MTIFFLVMALTACQQSEEQKQVAEHETELGTTSITDDAQESTNQEKLPIELTENEARFLVDDLFDIVDGDFIYNEIHRTLTMTIHDDQYHLIEGVPVLERNGEYLPTEDIYLMSEEEQQHYLPVAFLEKGLNLDIGYEEEIVVFDWFGPVEKVGGPPENFGFEKWGADEMVDYLSFLEKPIKDAEVSTISSHLPGAERAYRNGYHEGIDWYDFASGGDISTDTPVYAMAEGVVVRVDHDFEEYSSPEERNDDLKLTAALEETPEYIFDRLRGRQVWVQYDHGVMNRFAHLDDVPESLQVGDPVDKDTVIGYVGNSGTSGAVNQDSSELHLHQDLLIYGELFWKPLSQEEVRDVLVRIFQAK
ncbi:M23 family metallopeptidase [Desertibacillus haloalkaliphilus]|uniref:M23 family metallopeptidase n=1 Tax=Desertibacillus haloalkaliphilus TaxID=1328930 RepID=UPI001C27582C|nr:M23 family metallopeptidase [Desertibacillus haloalkaliphilus]MBU8906747.1 M23 family metallopeptidase [Desertibacillus haloalkaliphilus]